MYKVNLMQEMKGAVLPGYMPDGGGTATWHIDMNQVHPMLQMEGALLHDCMNMNQVHLMMQMEAVLQPDYMDLKQVHLKSCSRWRIPNT
jgi:hypothetical protein